MSLEFKKPNNISKMNWHEDFIVQLIKLLKPKIYVELGLYKCVLFNKVIPLVDSLIGVDICNDAHKYMKKSDKVSFINASTEDFANILKKNPISIDFLFIDADHSKEAVEKDFLNYLPFVSDNGFILIHDTYPGSKKLIQPGYCGDGYLAIEKLTKMTNEYEMLTIPNSPGLTICRKRQQHMIIDE